MSVYMAVANLRQSLHEHKEASDDDLRTCRSIASSLGANQILLVPDS